MEVKPHSELEGVRALLGEVFSQYGLSNGVSELHIYKGSGRLSPNKSVVQFLFLTNMGLISLV